MSEKIENRLLEVCSVAALSFEGSEIRILCREAAEEIQRLRAAAGGEQGGEAELLTARSEIAYLKEALRRAQGGGRGGEPKPFTSEDPEYTRISG